MNVTPENSSPGRAKTDAGTRIDDTLRLLANTPVPEGLADRIHTAIDARPQQSRISEWPTALEPGTFWGENAWGGSGWMRAAAAAAIVFVVAGGGWGVYLHVQRPAGRLMVTPLMQPVAQPVATPEGFSSAGAKRTPPTVKGPVVAQRVNPDTAAKRKKNTRAAARVGTVQPAAAGSAAQAGK
jgi:hypothetical protein